MNKLKNIWKDLNSSLWFLPALIVAGSVLIALGLVEIDKLFGGNWISGYPRLFGVEPAGSRDMLGTIAGSMITVAGIVFSIVIVALSLTSTQYTPRILRNFMRDQINQMVLGVFVGVFTYCIVVLRTIRGGDDDEVFVPSIAVIMGVVFALVGIGFLIYFIHHIAVSIQGSSIVSAICEETVKVIDEIFPRRLGDDAPETETDKLEKFAAEADWKTIRSTASGYIQNINFESLIDFTNERGAVVKMAHGIGEFIVAGAPLAFITSAIETANKSFPVDEDMTRKLNAVYSIDNYRTIDQDAAFGIRQIVDIIMKALSPGVNDTTTAVICIDYLTIICSQLAAHPFPSCFRFSKGRLQVVAKSSSFEDLIDLAFNQTRQNATDNIAVILRVLHSLEQIARRIEDGTDLHGEQKNLPAETKQARLEVVMRHLQMIIDAARKNVESKDDRAQIEKHIEKVGKQFNWQNRIIIESKIVSARI